MPLTTFVLLTLCHTLEVKVTGLHHERGHVRVAVFASSDGWPRDDSRALRRAVVAVVRGAATVRFEGLESGRYAAIAFHDEDDDGVLGTNLFGAPTEPWGASNDARALLGPPFEAAAFRVDAPTAITFAVKR